MEKVLRNSYIYLIVLILAAGFLVRIWDLGTHFTHYDDVFPAVDILKSKAPGYKAKIMSAAYDRNKPSYYDPQKKMLRIFNQNRLLKPFLDLGFKLSPLFVISYNATSAPLQYILISGLINSQQSYRETLFRGRLIPCLFSIAGLLVFFLVLKNSYKNKPHLVILGTAFYAFSWTSIVHAKQMHTYSAGLFAAVILLYLLSKDLKYSKAEQPVRHGVIPAILTYLHYQVVFFLPAYFLALYLSHEDNRSAVFKYVAYYLTLIAPVLFFLFFFNSSGVAPYTIGKHGEFLYTLHGKSFLGGIAYTVKFFFKNTFLIIQNNLTTIPERSPIYNALGWVFGLLLIIGTFVKNNHKPLKTFILWSFGVLFVLVLLRKVALTPTRQALMYLPLMIILVLDGLSSWKKTQHWLTALILAVIIGGFVFYYPGVIRQRQDPISDKNIRKIINTYKVKTVYGYGFTLNINLMHPKTINYLDTENLIQNKKAWDLNSIMLISTRRKYTPEDLQKLNKLLGKINPAYSVDLKNYSTVYKQEIQNPTEIEFNTRNYNGSNSLYIYVLKKDTAFY